MINNKFTVGDPEKDFFEQNPHWRYLDSSIKLLKLVPKDLASKLRWAVFLIEDPDSKYHRYSKLKRVEIVNENYLKGEYVIEYDPNTLTNINEDIKFLFDSYASETMSKIKRDYYERELSYEILVASERDCSDLKIKADVQLKLSRIYTSLEEARLALDKETQTEITRSRGTQQRGVLFNGD